ncbi:Six-hairpin glycosidase-like protein [Parachaetomium inaequale]|uniref:Six-hairpin glycosidase-like protein n=1 Tax=Parachaetomium inaequale TaxID=2588326 RepID=A0AAN6PBW8_9PEZI|nr:Six-hairpin glycosidase-like protein [Parachaetomium inaequale]
MAESARNATEAPLHIIPTPGNSSASSMASSPTEARDAGLLEGSLTSLSGNASTADTDDLNHTDETTSRQKHRTPDSPTIRSNLREAFAENILAKTCKVAAEALLRRAADPAGGFPEYCPQTGDDYGRYVLREPEFWTCGFFPGTLYTLLERAIRFPQFLEFHHESSAERPSPSQIRAHLTELCSAWSAPLHAMASRTDTHDLGFIIMPALRQDWELTHNAQSLASIVRAAHSLASRYVPSARAIRSWDLVRRRDMEIVGLDDNLLVIIDSMCNLDLLYYAAAHGGDGRLAEVATAHARTVLTTHLRPEEGSPPPPLVVEKGRKGGARYAGQLFSTCHVANLDPRTGKLQRRATAQGYADDSTWARGQAWAVLGYAQTYMWTGEREFLDAACGCAEYFLQRLDTAPACVDVVVDGGDEEAAAGTRTAGRYVPLWDFDAPIEDEADPTRDSSAGVIAANGMLVLSQALAGAGQADLANRFRDAAVAIVRDTLDFALAREKVRFRSGGDGGLVAEDVVEGSRFDALLAFGTANNNTYARKRYANHGLVYGDYYLVEFGNQLLRMGLALA